MTEPKEIRLINENLDKTERQIREAINEGLDATENEMLKAIKGDTTE